MKHSRISGMVVGGKQARVRATVRSDNGDDNNCDRDHDRNRNRNHHGVIAPSPLCQLDVPPTLLSYNSGNGAGTVSSAGSNTTQIG